MVWQGIFNKAQRLTPTLPIPAVKTDLKSLAASGEDVVVWLGHSSWYIQAGGKKFLIDPVFSDYAAPFSFLNRAFAGTSVYHARDLPSIDCLLISHDHYDHLDYSTVLALESKVRQVICPLGVGAYFEHWGYPGAKLREADWGDRLSLGEGVAVHVLPARHYSGRLFKENQTFWAGFAIETVHRKIFYSGDSGYGPHFSKIGERFQGFDLVLLDCGQYDLRWPYIHMTPEQASRAAADLRAKAFIPAHVGRFTIANHPWDEPFERVARLARIGETATPYQLLTRRIGDPVRLHGNSQAFGAWWRDANEETKTQ